jgi:thiamine-phosphate pyrophosphorylase
MELTLLTDTGTYPFATPARRVPRRAAATASMHELRSRIYFVTPQPHRSTSRLADLVRQALAGGAGIVQYRPHELSTREMVEQATALLRLARSAGVPLIIAGRVDVALAVGADGVHVGPEDMPVALARRLLGPCAIIGATVASAEDARVAQQDVATYLAVGPAFRSPAAEAEMLDGAEVTQMRRLTSLPLCAGGGVTVASVPRMAADPPDLIAVSAAICEAGNPTAATKALHDLVEANWPTRRPPP